MENSGAENPPTKIRCRNFFIVFIPLCVLLVVFTSVLNVNRLSFDFMGDRLRFISINAPWAGPVMRMLDADGNELLFWTQGRGSSLGRDTWVGLEYESFGIHVMRYNPNELTTGVPQNLLIFFSDGSYINPRDIHYELTELQQAELDLIDALLAIHYAETAPPGWPYILAFGGFGGLAIGAMLLISPKVKSWIDARRVIGTLLIVAIFAAASQLHAYAIFTR